MSEAANVIETRRPQMFPVLEPADIDRLRRFATPGQWPAGQAMVRIGEPAPGLVVLLSGKLSVRRFDKFGNRTLIVQHGPGEFMGELAQLSGRPSLVEVGVDEDVEALVLPSDRLRGLFMGEAELGERIMRALILRRVDLLETGAGGPIIIGPASDPDVLRLEGFLDRNGHPRLRLDPATDAEAAELIVRFHLQDAHLPIVLCPNGRLLRNPGEDELARCLGLVAPLDPDKVHDVVVVGAGPAGLATAVYAASEGLSVLVLDCRAFGGQAAASARIENYLGFPTGIGGLALMARAFTQAQKFGVDMAIPDQATSLTREPEGTYRIGLVNAERARARAVVIASGARYRRPDVPRLDQFEDSAVHYWATALEARLCAGQEVVLVGGGNSAGQAVVYLAGQVKKVWLLVRGDALGANMSRYLIDRIGGLPNVEVVTQAEVCGLEGEGGALEAVTWRDRRTGAETRRAIRHMFLFIGADPNTDWLAGSGVALDASGFVITGEGIHPGMETSVPGVFAIGDVRSGSVKRVAAGVGEGAQVVAAIHRYLADADHAAAAPAKEPA